MLSYLRFLALAVVLGSSLTAEAAPVWNPVIQTSKGQVVGVTGDVSRRFTLPYAKPPVGNLRFDRPGPKLLTISMGATYYGTELPKACLQNGRISPTEQSEDCLYMNIYTPKAIAYERKLPVMVWVHGGSFAEGGIAGLDGSKLASSQNMIVVMVQYRLGLFGWLKYPRFGFEGNYGLRDLILALQVVQQDISAFGGDPSLVTLAGQISVAKSLLLDNLNIGSRFNLYADKLPNSVSDNTLLGAQQNVAFLAATNQLPGVAQAEPFNLLLDDKLFSADGDVIARSGKQVIYTTVKDEACAAVSTGIQVASQLVQIPSDDFEGLVKFSFPERAQAIVDSKLYQPTEDDEETIAQDLVRLTTDFAWTCPNQRDALAAAKGATVYLGEFDLGIQAAPTAETSLCAEKFGHEDDIAVVFGTSSSLSSAQTALVKEVQARWAAFARTGNPTPSSYPTWPALDSAGGLQILQLGTPRTAEA
ncbi:hypothetical protein JCM16303_001249 [Sporobolomyces ruberrimus]